MKSEGKLIPLNDAEVAYFKEQVKKGEDVRVIDLSEENFMRMEFTDTVSGIDVDLLNQMSEQKKYEEVGEVEDLPGNILSGWEEIMIKSRQNRERRFYGFGKETKNKIIGEMSYLKCRDIERTAVFMQLSYEERAKIVNLYGGSVD